MFKRVKLYILITMVFVACCPFASDAGNNKTARSVREDIARGITLPTTDGHYNRTKYYVEDIVDNDYMHASKGAHDSFRDIKFAVRIHWGIYSVWQMNGESWGFLDLPAEKKQEYNSLYKTFSPVGFDAQRWMNLFRRCGIRAMTFTTKHHEGFSMFDTKTRVTQRVNYTSTDSPIEQCDLAYSIMETPYGRDIVAELCDAARKNSIKIGLYYSHPDWYDADFRPYNYHPLGTQDIRDNPEDYGHEYLNNRITILTDEPSAQQRERMLQRHRKQIEELLTNYGKIDMLCLDQWLGKNVWPQTKQTVKMIRQLQPDVMIRARGVGNYGDYYTPENFVPGEKENTNMPWMTIYPLGESFSYDKCAQNYKGAQWVIQNIIDCAAKGGSFMVGIGPDSNGLFHPQAESQLLEVGEWLKVCGRGIYATRECDVWQNGGVRFTKAKDGKRVFAFVDKWSESELFIPAILPKRGSKVYMLGYDRPLNWRAKGDGVIITIDKQLEVVENRPCRYAWGFEIRVN